MKAHANSKANAAMALRGFSPLSLFQTKRRSALYLSSHLKIRSMSAKLAAYHIRCLPLRYDTPTPFSRSSADLALEGRLRLGAAAPSSVGCIIKYGQTGQALTGYNEAGRQAGRYVKESGVAEYSGATSV